MDDSSLPQSIKDKFEEQWMATIMREVEPFIGLDWSDNNVFDDVVCTFTQAAHSIGWAVEPEQMYKYVTSSYAEMMMNKK